MKVRNLIIFTIIAGVATLASGWHPISFLFYGLVGTLVLSIIFALLSGFGLSFSRSFTGGRLQSGDLLIERLQLGNRTFLPKFFVQVVDQSTLPGHNVGYVATIGPRKRVDWRVSTQCTRRGHYAIGPTMVTFGDPLGLFSRDVLLGKSYDLLVLPHVLPLTQFNIFPGLQSGRGQSPRRSLQSTTNVVTVREYVPGDPLSHIHWPSSARHNALMVKEFDLDPTIDIWIVLDLDDRYQRGELDDSTEEYSVTIAASLGSYFLSRDLSVGLIVNDINRPFLMLDRGERQLYRILEVLADAHASVTPPVQDMLTLHEPRFSRNSSVVVISPSTDQNFIATLRILTARGVHSGVIALDADSFLDENEEKPDAKLRANAIMELKASNIPLIPIQRHASLVEELEQGAQRARGNRYGA